MKKVAFFLFVAGTLVSCSDSGKTNDAKDSTAVVADTLVKETVSPYEFEPTHLSKSTAGVFIIGKDISEVQTIYKLNKVEEVRQTEEGEEKIPVYNVDAEAKTMIKLTVETNEKNAEIISEINVLSPDFQTKDSVGVGTTLVDFQKKYPGAKIFYTYVSGMFWVDTDELPGMQFILDGEDFETKNKDLTSSDSVELKASEFKSSAKIKSVRIWE